MDSSRRDLLVKAWKAGAGLLGIAAGWTAYESLRPLAGSEGGGRIDVGRARDIRPGRAKYVNEGRLYVVNADGDYLALFQKCPHLGCRVPFCESSGRFECPCHGSVFNLGGEHLAGPSPRGMDRYPVEQVGERLVVDTSNLIRGDEPGEHRYGTEAIGPACVEEA